jgi:subtilisin family serine protease
MFCQIRILFAVAALAIAAGTTPRMMAAQGPPEEAQAGGPGQPRRANSIDAANDVYIVQMADAPVLSYAGGIPGRAATRQNSHRRKIDTESPDVAGYAQYLDARHDEVLARAGGRKLYGYRYSFNGFAARLSPDAAEALKSAPGVVRVVKDELRRANTSSTPAFLGLDAPGGLWDQLAGPEHAGEDIIIGVVDSGVWPESLSFTDREDRSGNPSSTGRVVYDRMNRWRNRCQSGEQFSSNDCNNKLIGAQRFNAAWGGDAGIAEDLPWEFTSPRDYNGHGTHTASTAGGNHRVPTTGDAAVFGPVSGIAPRARIAVYKALWSNQDASEANGFTSDLVAAIDKAVADGVDVLNYSVSGTSTNFADPAEIAFFNAAQSGVFVSASAGNDGPAVGTVAHPSPWITTVAAGTHNRDGKGSVTLGNGVTHNGASLAKAVGPAPLIDSNAAGLAGANATALSLCFTASDNAGQPVLDPAKVAGKIVVCDRGVNARVNKSLAVQQAGGIGMILVNTTAGQSVNADFHFVPTVHLDNVAGAAVTAYAATANPTATINKATIVFDVPAPFTAAFSSRGPLLAGGGDLLKPDLIAPGQDILAAVAPPGNAGRSFNVYSGTSMSAPHVAGLAALLMHRSRADGDRDHDHDRGRDRGRGRGRDGDDRGRGRGHDDDDDDEGWSPMMIKSALMTTATDVLDGPNTSASVIFSQGAGHVSPNDAARPGLVFDSDEDDWVAFMCGAAPAAIENPRDCRRLARRGFSFDASDLNVPSIAIGDMAGSQTVTRTVTNVSRSSSRYTASFTGMAGINVVVSPASFTVRPGKSTTFTVTFTRTTAPINTYTGGQLLLTDGNHDVRVPMVVRPVALSAPAEVFSTGGPISYQVKFGYTGAFTATPRGLVPATTFVRSVADDPANSFDPNEGEGVTIVPVPVAPGTTLARFSLFDSHVTPPSDLDLYVFAPDGSFLDLSGTSGSNEEVTLFNPQPGTHFVVVHGFEVPTPPGEATFTLFTWNLGSASAGNMTVTAPATAVTGATGTIGLAFSDLITGRKYLGSIVYGGETGLPNPTIVRVDP